MIDLHAADVDEHGAGSPRREKAHHRLAEIGAEHSAPFDIHRESVERASLPRLGERHRIEHREWNRILIRGADHLPFANIEVGLPSARASQIEVAATTISDAPIVAVRPRLSGFSAGPAPAIAPLSAIARSLSSDALLVAPGSCPARLRIGRAAIGRGLRIAAIPCVLADLNCAGIDQQPDDCIASTSWSRVESSRAAPPSIRR